MGLQSSSLTDLEFSGAVLFLMMKHTPAPQTRYKNLRQPKENLGAAEYLRVKFLVHGPPQTKYTEQCHPIPAVNENMPF